MALVGLAAGQETVTWTYDTGVASTTSKATWRGIQFVLTDSASSYGITSDVEEAVFADTQMLTSITLTSVVGPYSNGIMGVLYDNATNIVLGKVNSNTLTTSAGSLIFDFSNSAITLNADSSYTMAFTSANNAAFTVGASVSGNGGDYLKVGVYTSADSTVSADSNLTYDDVTTASLSAGSVPGIKIVTTSVYSAPESPVVPEPATATLSLLALAGLAARRRRR